MYFDRFFKKKRIVRDFQQTQQGRSCIHITPQSSLQSSRYDEDRIQIEIEYFLRLIASTYSSIISEMIFNESAVGGLQPTKSTVQTLPKNRVSNYERMRFMNRLFEYTNTFLVTFFGPNCSTDIQAELTNIFFGPTFNPATKRDDDFHSFEEETNQLPNTRPDYPLIPPIHFDRSFNRWTRREKNKHEDVVQTARQIVSRGPLAPNGVTEQRREKKMLRDLRNEELREEARMAAWEQHVNAETERAFGTSNLSSTFHLGTERPSIPPLDTSSFGNSDAGTSREALNDLLFGYSFSAKLERQWAENEQRRAKQDEELRGGKRYTMRGRMGRSIADVVSESNENQRERKRREVSGAKTDKLWMASKAKSPIFSLVKPTHLENRIYGKADRIGDVECVLWKYPDLSEVDLVHLSQTTLADEVNRLDEMYSERNRRHQNRTKLARILDADEVVQSDTIRRFGGMPSMEERDNARLSDFAFQFGTAFQMRHTTFGDSELSESVPDVTLPPLFTNRTQE
ncbi:hypothetical protein BLNAU_190 [Blattamonas nauphoetae]|uniref:Uncharacterized protein n=1 Tax=Blattamonas nauphoetae TaxID=2049346 RepID=A0ABQ9YMA2_9EUKA|nr:hypothetical protein BLNAU_190 [Blattamonas nauphoetae]